MRALTLDTAPAADFLEDAVVWDHLRVETTGSPAQPEDATLIGVYRDMAQEYLGGTNGILGYSIITQTWKLKLDAFPWEGWAHPVGWRRSARDAGIVIPRPPLQSIDSIQYVDTAGVTQTLDSSKYDVLDNGKNAPALVVPSYNESWPSTRDQPHAVTITFTAGYGNSASDVPANIIALGLLLVEGSYNNRSSESVGYELHVSPAVNALIEQARLRYFYA